MARRSRGRALDRRRLPQENSDVRVGGGPPLSPSRLRFGGELVLMVTRRRVHPEVLAALILGGMTLLGAIVQAVAYLAR